MLYIVLRDFKIYETSKEKTGCMLCYSKIIISMYNVEHRTVDMQNAEIGKSEGRQFVCVYVWSAMILRIVAKCNAHANFEG